METIKMLKVVLLMVVFSLAIIMQSCTEKKPSEETTDKTSDKSSENTSKTSQKNIILADGDNAKSGRVDSIHMTRYLEMYLAFEDPKAKELVAACYNSMFTPKGIPASKNTCPQNLVEGLDFEKMKTEFGVLGVSLNGPKLWQPDWTEIEEGVTRDFNGIEATWCAQLNMGDKTSVDKLSPYKPLKIARKSSLGWNKGTKVFLIDDADGNTWIMKGFELGVHPTHTYEEFLAKGESNFKNLPEGWKFRIKVLEKDYIETPESGWATVMPDEFYNVYDKTGPGMGNYKP